MEIIKNRPIHSLRQCVHKPFCRLCLPQSNRQSHRFRLFPTISSNSLHRQTVLLSYLALTSLISLISWDLLRSHSLWQKHLLQRSSSHPIHWSIRWIFHTMRSKSTKAPRPFPLWKRLRHPTQRRRDHDPLFISRLGGDMNEKPSGFPRWKKMLVGGFNPFEKY